MSVLIKGTEMPTSCGDCKAFVCYRQWAGDSGDCFCGITKSDAKAKEKNADCPLVHVPPHGDLIERDKVNLTDLEIVMCNGDYKEGMKMLLEKIESAPAIIPASEDAKTEEDTEPWLCLSCRNYPPSSTDGKPCTQCDPSEVWHSCYDPAEEGE